MGVGPDSLPVEVDPLSNLSQGRAAAAARRKAGRSALPTKGVSVLLGRLPPGCVARGFAQEVRAARKAAANQWGYGARCIVWSGSCCACASADLT
jgi:hypothetical protein